MRPFMLAVRGRIAVCYPTSFLMKAFNLAETRRFTPSFKSLYPVIGKRLLPLT
jgi:hypothetical protein